MSQDHQWERMILQVKLQTLASAKGGDWCLGKSDSAGKTTDTGLS